jgi:predicted NAD/FAD-dependent oxidoreductase
MMSRDPQVQEIVTRWLGTKWTDSQGHPGSKIWHFANNGRDIAEHWAYGLRVQRNHVTHLVEDHESNLGVVRHGFGEPIWGRNVVLTAPVPQSQAIIAYSDFALDYSLDDVTYRRRQVLLATMEGDGIEPDSHWSTDIIESIRLRPHHEGLLGIEASASESWSEATWDDDSTISHGRLLLELGVLIGQARVMDTQVMRWRYSVTENPHTQRCWSHPERPNLYMAGDGFGDNLDREYSIERAIQSAMSVFEQLTS